MSSWEQQQRWAREYAQLLFQFTDAALQVPLLSRAGFIQQWAGQVAERMVLQALHGNARSWRSASRDVMRGLEISTLLQRELAGPVGTRVAQLVKENATLIRTLPAKVAEQAAKEQATRYAEGRRPANEPALLRYIAKWQALRIARTETSKANAALTRARSEELGLDWYVWRTSRDARVRASHRKMEGVLVRWDDQPSPEALAGERSYGHYAAGEIFNCRCYSEPLLRLSAVTWPHHVYSGGTIRPMTLNEFRKLNHLPQREQRLGIAA